MRCPKCEGKTKVRKVFNVIRQRFCLACEFRFFTEEVMRK